MTMEVTRRRIRRDYAPLNVSVSVICPTTGSPLTQVYSAAGGGTYEPNREITATMLQPIVVLNATDGSLSSPYGNEKLGEVHWLCNGDDISTLKDWIGKYEIRTDGSMKGSLMISRNVAVNERLTMVMEAQIYDSRLGVNIPIRTDGVILSTTDKSEDMYTLAADCAPTHRYNPFNDRLARYEYKVAHGQAEENAEERAAATDENSYMLRIPLRLYCGAEQVSADKYAVRLWRKGEDGGREELLADGRSEAALLTAAEIRLDLRTVESGSYMIEAVAGGTAVARAQFGVARDYPVFRVEPSNISNFPPTAKQHYDEAMVSCGGQTVDCASSVVRLVWKSVTAKNATPMRHNEGGSTLIDLDKAGVGDTFDTDWIEISVEAEQKRAYSIAADENGDILTDEDGNTLIFN